MESSKKRKYNERKKMSNLNQLAEDCGKLIQEKDYSVSSPEKESSTESECVLQYIESIESNKKNLSESSDDSVKSGCPYNDFQKDSVINFEPEIKDIRTWIIKNNIPHKNADELLTILQKRLLPNIPKCAKTLLKCDVNIEDLESMKVSDGSEGEFIYYGIESQLQRKVQIKLHSDNLLEIIINIDGFSPFKSSPVSIWPILCKVHTELDFYEPFSVAVYAGNGKPKSSTDYLTKFVQELNEVLKSGVCIEGRHFNIKIKFFVCDCPARSFLKCVVGHVAFAGCERCRVCGKKVDRVTVFLETDAEKRTNTSFLTFQDPDCHTGVSLLTTVEPSIDMVSQFVLDPMHLIFLGCTKRLLDYLLSASTRKVRLSATLKTELVRRTQLINKDIPEEFSRKMRSTDQYTKYKAVEFKFFLLYAAPVVLKKLVTDDIYSHWLLLTVACRLLSNKDTNFNIEEARKHLRTFVERAPTVYDPTIMSLNMHNLIHVCDDVESTGCSLNELSAFSFESYLGSMSSVLRSPTHLVAQYTRRMFEKETFLKKEIVIPPEEEILMKTKKEIVKIRYKQMILSIKHPNNVILLQDGSVARIQKFTTHIDDSIKHLIVQKYSTKEPVFSDPCNSGDLNIWEVKKLSKTQSNISLNHIKQKCINFNLNFSKEEDTRSFVLPLLH